MLTLPANIIAVLAPFAPLFSPSVFVSVQVLLIGSILTPGKRTVTAALRVMGLAHTPHFQNYHRVLNRAQWSSLQAAKILLGLLVTAFAPDGPLVLGIDETLERRQGERIAQKGIYRDAARSSRSVFVKSSGLRWVVLMLLVPIPWADRVWALPFLSVLAPSERYAKEHHKRHKTLSQWAEQMLLQVRRWLPERSLVLVADGGYAVITLLARLQSLARPVTCVTRLRLDAALYEPAPLPVARQIGRPRKKGKRLPTLQQIHDDPATVWTPLRVARWYSQGERDIEIVSQTARWYHSGMPPVALRWVLLRDPCGKFASQALLCTDTEATPEQIIAWFVQRWQLETTFQEVRTHLGVETQRQWSEKAIVRETPALLGLFSLVTLAAKPYVQQQGIWGRQASWYRKKQATFSDTIALVRYHLWRDASFCISPFEPDVEKFGQQLLDRLTETLCYAA